MFYHIVLDSPVQQMNLLYLYTHTYILWSISFPFSLSQNIEEFPVLNSRFSLVIYFIHSITLPVHQTPQLFPLASFLGETFDQHSYFLCILCFLVQMCKFQFWLFMNIRELSNGNQGKIKASCEIPHNIGHVPH